MSTLRIPKESPRKLNTPPGTSEYTMHTEQKDGVEILVCTVGKTVLHYDARCIPDLCAMLKTAGDWVDLAARMNRSQRRKALWRLGAVLPATPLAAGMG